MPAIDLQLNDKSAYPEQGQIESISGVIDRSTGTVSLRAVSLIRTDCCTAAVRVT